MNKKVRRVEEDDYGVYVWVIPDGRKVADEEGRVMNIPSRKNDLDKIFQLKRAAEYYGFPEGRPVFLASHRQVTDAEYEDQLARLKAGLVPDPLDYNAMKEEVKYARKSRDA